ncbi:hypothetical protein ABT336_12080 [Micromonospora sp. NPDC000207]
MKCRVCNAAATVRVTEHRSGGSTTYVTCDKDEPRHIPPAGVVISTTRI